MAALLAAVHRTGATGTAAPGGGDQSGESARTPLSGMMGGPGLGLAASPPPIIAAAAAAAGAAVGWPGEEPARQSQHLPGQAPSCSPFASVLLSQPASGPFAAAPRGIVTEGRLPQPLGVAPPKVRTWFIGSTACIVWSVASCHSRWLGSVCPGCAVYTHVGLTVKRNLTKPQEPEPVPAPVQHYQQQQQPPLPQQQQQQQQQFLPGPGMHANMPQQHYQQQQYLLPPFPQPCAYGQYGSSGGDAGGGGGGGGGSVGSDDGELSRPLTPEQKAQRRKEKAREYSRVARRRQEQYVNELRARVEVLGMYHYLVEECGPDLVFCLSPDMQARVLFANGLAARTLGVDAGALVGQ